MVYTEPQQLGWAPMFESWLLQQQETLGVAGSELVTIMAAWLFDPLLAFVRKNCNEAVPTADINLPWAALQLLDSMLRLSPTEQLTGRSAPAHIQAVMIMSLVWSFGGAVSTMVRHKLGDGQQYVV